MIGTSTERMERIHQLCPEWTPRTLWDHFCFQAERFEKQPYIIYQNADYTYGRIREMADTTARALMEMGVRPGDHVAVALQNSPEYVALVFALAKIGAIKVSVIAQARGAYLQQLLLSADVQYFFCCHAFEEDELDALSFLKKIVVHGAETMAEHPSVVSMKEFLLLADGADDTKVKAAYAACQDPFAISDLMFTSGSTKQPKVVSITHDMLLRSSFGTCCTRCMEEGRRIFVPIPLFHVFAYNEGLLAVSHVGGALILSDRKFSVEHALSLMKEAHANDIITVPMLMIQILTKGIFHHEDYPDLHAIYVAGATPEWLWDDARAKFGVSDITTGYGMTECGSTSTIMSPEAPDDYIHRYHGRIKTAGAAGSELYGDHLIEMEIRHPETRARLETGQTGVIWCRGLTVTPGYYQNPEANEQAFDEDGWFCTNDLGVMNEEGYLSFLGRNDDVYKINGENVSPQYLDHVIGKNENVRAVECVGIPDEKCGAVGVAFIDAYQNTAQKAEELAEFCRQSFLKYQIPKWLILLDSVDWAKTPTGKVTKSGLKKMAISLLSPSPESAHEEAFDKALVCRIR